MKFSTLKYLALYFWHFFKKSYIENHRENPYRLINYNQEFEKFYFQSGDLGPTFYVDAGCVFGSLSIIDGVSSLEAFCMGFFSTNHMQKNVDQFHLFSTGDDDLMFVGEVIKGQEIIYLNRRMGVERKLHIQNLIFNERLLASFSCRDSFYMGYILSKYATRKKVYSHCESAIRKMVKRDF